MTTEDKVDVEFELRRALQKSDPGFKRGRRDSDAQWITRLAEASNDEARLSEEDYEGLSKSAQKWLVEAWKCLDAEDDVTPPPGMVLADNSDEGEETDNKAEAKANGEDKTVVLVEVPLVEESKATVDSPESQDASTESVAVEKKPKKLRGRKAARGDRVVDHVIRMVLADPKLKTPEINAALTEKNVKHSAWTVQHYVFVTKMVLSIAQQEGHMR